MRPVDIYALSRTLYSFSGYLGLALEEAGHSDPALARELTALQNTVLDLRRAMLAGDNDGAGRTRGQAGRISAGAV